MLKLFHRLAKVVLNKLPIYGEIFATAGTAAPITVKTLIFQKVLGFNRTAYWPMHFTSTVSCPSRIRIGIGTAPGLSPGCYIQGINGINIGDYTIVAPHVGLISANHDPYDHQRHLQSPPIVIGRYCWIGMNAVILPGVTLGDHTVVAAGAVVTKSFPDGYAVLAGVPAAVARVLDASMVRQHRNLIEYIGYHRLRDGDKNRLYRHLGVANTMSDSLS